MHTVDFTTLTIRDVWYENDPEMRLRVEFPFTASTGTSTTSVVYFEIEPGHRLGTHTDSVEEIVVVLQGAVEATLGDERGHLSAGSAVLIPAMVPHGMRNTGNETARCIGFFSAAGVESVFDQPVMPFGTRVVSTVVERAV